MLILIITVDDIIKQLSSLSAPEQRVKNEEKVKGVILVYLSDLSNHLSSRTFLVGERLSVADISVFASYLTLLKLDAIKVVQSPTYRWFMTVAANSAISAVVGDVSGLCAAPAIGTKTKWDRQRIRVKELLNAGLAMIGKEITLKGNFLIYSSNIML